MVFTVFMGRRAEQPAVEFAEPLRGAATSLTVFDRLPWWLLAAAVLVIVAYAYPLIHHLGTTRFGAPVIIPF